MPAGPSEPVDLLDLKLVPAWVKETPDTKAYEHYAGEDYDQGSRRGRDDRGPRGRRPEGRGGARPSRGPGDRDRGRGGDRGRGPQNRNRPQGDRKQGAGRGEQRGGFRPHDRPSYAEDRERSERELQALAARVAVRFLPHPPVLENVSAQIKSNPVAYSVFGLARLFLEKPERYDVRLTAKPEEPLFQLGENPAVSSNREFLESGAFRVAQDDFYQVEVTQTEPVKGNFSSVARDRVSGTLLGPTNHHGYQPRLRSLYEQRYSRRMSFPDYQRQIEMVSDPAVIEQWKEEARTITSFVTTKEEPPLKFNNPAETERHFRQHYLPGLVHPVTEVEVNGLTSRNLADRVLRRLVEEAWAREARSPSQMMHEISSRFREDGLQIFRHRKGMLFVISVRVRPFAHEETGVSAQVQAILQAIGGQAGIGRKELADKLLLNVPAEEMESRKIALAADLKWLLSEGYVIEFNDGSLDLPRAKVKPVGEKKPAPAEAKAETPAANDAAATPPAVEPVANEEKEHSHLDSPPSGEQMHEAKAAPLPVSEPPSPESGNAAPSPHGAEPV